MIENAALQRYSLFGGLLPEQIQAISSLLGQESYAAGEIIQKEGDPNDKIRFILEGRVSVTKASLLLIELGEGDTFGEMEILDVMPSAATVRAEVPVAVAVISNRTIRQLYKLDTQAFALIMMNLARDLSRRLRRMDELRCREVGGTSPVMAPGQAASF
ncbi:MAG: cyclic nucleotide-binding protein [Treponema sp. GWB1_62_6]|nr:MAG: cyclic nucleotide-binding protein [Treponema sp. GWA1_62_8]OHE66063.1 MAG: cyclic nucleotide-binding protein [Treponema sp. GWC1_61_84]OHE71000.1 MAG: cyclic nucleotide-binding protein [Treponema sp. GWB1_62_6]OHE74479.1 MAG: cyclic nucleotide-binding protein [Treponema sp. RIFOXYC1_FULL_61_9]HCM25660.1 cyclic nucleotide-binding protein [Treponema sp.]